MKRKNFKRLSFFKNTQNKFNKGFTLVELLVVIAVLGVLAAVVITALNPAEQLNRGRDTGRLTSVTQLGDAMLRYATNQGTGAYPTLNLATWQTTYLVQNTEINQTINIANPAPGACTTNVQGNVCYTSSGVDAVIWTIDESQSAKSKAGCGVAGGAFANSPIAAAAWIASQGKAGVTCLTATNVVPAYNAQLF